MFHLGLSIQCSFTFLFSSAGPVVDLYVNQASFMRLTDTLIYEHNNKSVWVSLILYQFSRVIVADSPLEHMICLSIGSWPYNYTRYRFHLVK